MSDIQVTKEHYYSSDYNHKARWITYFYQIRLLVDYGCNTALEIGPGHGWMKQISKDFGVSVETVDFDPALQPDYVGEVGDLPLDDNSYDCVCAFEVLEHLPFTSLKDNILEMARVSKNYVIFSVPDHRRILLHLRVKVPFIKYKELIIRIPTFKKHVFDGQHYWEIGKRSYGVGAVKRVLQETGLELVDHFVRSDAPMNHYFVLKK